MCPSLSNLMSSLLQPTGIRPATSRARAATGLPTPVIYGALALLALLIGGAVALVAKGPTFRMAVTVLGLSGVLGMIGWAALRLPLVPPLRLGLLTSPFLILSQVTLFADPEVKWGQAGLTVSLMLILSVMLGIGYLSRRWAGQTGGRVFPRSFSLALGGLFGWCALSAVYGASSWKGLCGLWALSISMMMCFLIAESFAEREALRAGVICLAIIITLSCVLGFLQAYSESFNLWRLVAPDLEWADTLAENKDVTRISGLFAASTGFAWCLTTCAPVLIAMLLLRVDGFRPWQRLLLLVASVFSVIALVMTYARGSWIAFAISMPMLGAFAYRARPAPERRRVTWGLGLIFVIVALLCLPFADTIYQRLTEDDQGAAYARVPLAQVALEMIEHNPWLGVGLNCYESEMRRYDRTSESITDTLPSAVHNMYLYISAEVGILGGVFFLALIASSFWQGWLVLRGRDPFLSALAMGLMTGLAAYMLTGLKEPGWLGGYMLHLCFLFCGLLIAARRVSFRQAARPAK
jgi:hypothetical protein